MSDRDQEVTVTHNPQEHRYEVRLDGSLAGFAEYHDKPGRRVFTHTQIDDAFEGHGLGSRLAADALDDVRQHGLKVEPLCPFIAEYIRRHEDSYGDLVSA